MDGKIQTTLSYDNGDSYIGQAVDGVREGYGVYTSLGVTLSGMWTNNHLNGQGVMQTPNFKYEGGFKNSLRNGFGKEVHKDGKVYEGEFLNGVKHGKMKLTLPNGAYITCNYSHGVGEGDGIMVMTDGERVKVKLSGGKMWFNNK